MLKNPLMRSAIVLVGMLAVSRVLEKRGTKLAGNFMGLPYDFRTPNLERAKERLWNPADSRIITPHVYGIGWSINLHSLAKKARLIS